MEINYDVVIIGGGANGLCVGAYLAKAGQKVLVIEKTYEMGGGMATEQPAMGGFYFNTHSIYHLMTEYAPPYQHFVSEFERRVKYVYPQPAVVAPFPDGRCICLYTDPEKAAQSIAQFSQKDAEAYKAMYTKHAEFMQKILAPGTYVLPEPGILTASRMETTPLGKEFGKITPKSPRKQVEETFENDHIRALMLYLACHWGLEPEVDGIGYLVPLMLNRAVNSGLLLGGSHNLASALNRVILDNGGMQLTSTLIKRIVVENGIATGVEIEDGRIYHGKAIVSTIDPFQTFLKYVGEDKLEKEFISKTNNFKPEAWSLLTIHLSLWDAPNYTATAQNPDINKALMHIWGLDTMQGVVDHFKETISGKLSANPIAYGCFPTVHDRMQAPNRPDRHTLTMSSEAPYKLNGNPDNWWDKKLKEDRVYQIVKLIEKHAPNMTAENVMWPYICSPLDLENKLNNMFQGSYKCGGYKPLQMGFLRPNEQCSQVKTPVKNLYLCGASCNPGGMVTFGPGYLGAQVVAKELGVEQWWKDPDFVAEYKKTYGFE